MRPTIKREKLETTFIALPRATVRNVILFHSKKASAFGFLPVFQARRKTYRLVCIYFQPAWGQDKIRNCVSLSDNITSAVRSTTR